MQVKTYPRQWLGDIALQVSGSLESMIQLALQNDMSITDDPPLFMQVNEQQLVVNKSIRKYFAQYNIVPVTGLTAEDEQSTRGGIGFMGIQINFKVS